jgi:hypothetical protein
MREKREMEIKRDGTEKGTQGLDLSLDPRDSYTQQQVL